MYMLTGEGLEPAQQVNSCSGWEKDPESFSKIIAEYYVGTELGLPLKGKSISCRPDGKLCDVTFPFPFNITVRVSLVRIPDFVIARQVFVKQGAPRREYNYSCPPTGSPKLTRRPQSSSIPPSTKKTNLYGGTREGLGQFSVPANREPKLCLLEGLDSVRVGEGLGRKPMLDVHLLAGSLGANSFSPDVQAFLDQVNNDPKKFDKILLAVKFHPIPWVVLREGLKHHSSSKVWHAILNSPDPNALANDVVNVLGAIRLQYRKTNSSFDKLVETEQMLREDVDTAIICVINFRRLRHHLTNALNQRTLSGIVKSGQNFIRDEFRKLFPKLTQSILKSAVPETIFAHIGFDLQALALDRQKDAKAFKQWTEQACKQRRQQH